MIDLYALLDPRTHELRYIGITSKTAAERLKGHLSSSRENNPTTYNARWLKSLGELPQVIVFAQFDDWKSACEAEKYWIAFFREIGCKLTNLRYGGEGGGSLWTEETRKIHMEAAKRRRGQKRSDATRARMSAASKGRPKSATHIAAIAAGHVGTTRSSEIRDKMSKSALANHPCAYSNDEIASLILSGWSVNRMGKELGIPTSRATKIRRDLGVHPMTNGTATAPTLKR